MAPVISIRNGIAQQLSAHLAVIDLRPLLRSEHEQRGGNHDEDFDRDNDCDVAPELLLDHELLYSKGRFETLIQIKCFVTRFERAATP